VNSIARTVIAIVCLTFVGVAQAEPSNWVGDALRALPLLNLQPTAEPEPPTDPALSKPHPAVARIIVPEADGTTYGSGTLVDVRGDYGLVVTNWHVVETARQELWVEFSDGFRSAGKLLKVDRDWDLAAIAIWRPNASPVALAEVAPRPGDPLVIAGFGNGPFRAARGECLQYVTPSLELPLEMVQVTAAARNGDSGGPIFNEHGELAGVLFGTGEGVTSGSYCGRVNQFLASVLPKEPPTETKPAAPVSTTAAASSDGWTAPADAARAAPSTITVNEAAHAPPATVQDFGLSATTDSKESPPEPESNLVAKSVAEASQEPVEGSSTSPVAESLDVSQVAVRRDAVDRADTPSTAANEQENVHSEIDWLALTGASAGERVKTALAIVGLFTLVWHTVRLMGGSRAPAAS